MAQSECEARLHVLMNLANCRTVFHCKQLHGSQQPGDVLRLTLELLAPASERGMCNLTRDAVA